MDIIYIINKHINHQITDQSHYLFCFMSMVVINLWNALNRFLSVWDPRYASFYIPCDCSLYIRMCICSWLKTDKSDNRYFKDIYFPNTCLANTRPPEEILTVEGPTQCLCCLQTMTQEQILPQKFDLKKSTGVMVPPWPSSCLGPATLLQTRSHE